MKYREQFSKLLATENIRLVQKGGAKTAAFDTMNRVLYLPVWDVSESVYDMLVAHEVSHALHTPQGDRRVSIARYNIVEDARIERLILAKYPGYERIFKEAYIEVKTALPVFGELLAKLDELKSIDRLNLAWKFRDNSFLNEVELDWFYRGMKTESFEECVDLADEIVAYVPPEPEPEPEPPMGEGDGSEEADGDYDSDEEAGDGASDEAEEDDDDELDAEVSEVDTGDKSDEESDEDEAEGDKSDDEGDKSDEESEAEGADGEGDKSDEESDEDEAKGESADEGDEAESADETDDSKSEGDASSDDIGADENAEDADAESKPSNSASGASDNKSEEEDNNSEDDGTETQDLFNDFAEDNVKSQRGNDQYAPLNFEETALRNHVKNNFVKSEYNSVQQMLDSPTAWRKLKREIVRRESMFDASKPITRNFVKEFKRRKNAHDLLRTQTHRTGKINAKKLYRYKMDDNIFLSRNVVEGAVNHGLTMFVDFSGSMQGRLNHALAMVYSLSEFSRQCGIKFQVFGFLAGWNNRERDPKELIGEGIFNVNASGVEIFKMVDHNMTMKQIRVNLHQASRRYLGGTPLDATVLASRVLHGDFLKKHQIEKSMVVFLTDGGNGERVDGNFTYSDGSVVECGLGLGHNKTRKIVDEVEKLLPGSCKIINIFMTRWANSECKSFKRTHIVSDSTFSKTKLNVNGCTTVDGLEAAVENHASNAKEINKIITEIIKEFA